MRRSRLQLLAAPAAVLMSAGLVACGAGSDPDGDSGTAAESSLPAAEGTTQYPLTLTTWLGESTLEERPERIAVVGFSSNLDALEALDVVPVYYGGRDADADYPWNDADYLDAIETIDVTDGFEINPEAVAASEPDLIVTFGMVTEEAEFDRLTSIAPVLDLPEDPGQGDKTDWRAVQAQLGEALDLSDAAATAVAEADERIAAVAAAHPEFAGKTATVVYDYGPEYGMDYYTVAGGPAEGLMIDLGFEPNPSAESFTADPAVSDENQGLLDADALVVIYSTETDRANREGQGLFAAIPAVAQGRYESLLYPVDAGPNDDLTTSEGREVGNAVWPLRRGASAISFPWAAEVVADEWLADIPLG